MNDELVVVLHRAQWENEELVREFEAMGYRVVKSTPVWCRLLETKS